VVDEFFGLVGHLAKVWLYTAVILEGGFLALWCLLVLVLSLCQAQ